MARVFKRRLRRAQEAKRQRKLEQQAALERQLALQAEQEKVNVLAAGHDSD